MWTHRFAHWIAAILLFMPMAHAQDVSDTGGEAGVFDEAWSDSTPTVETDFVDVYLGDPASAVEGAVSVWNSIVALVEPYLNDDEDGDTDPSIEAETLTVFETGDQQVEGEEDLASYTLEGSNIYLICIFGDRDVRNSVPRKCRSMKARLIKDYPYANIYRLDNPSQTRLERLQRRVGDDIAMLIVVTHSGPGPDDTWDVWDCPMQPEDIANIFEDDWVIWFGCESFGICQEADNILPVMPEPGCVDGSDEIWSDIVGCLEQSRGRPLTRDEVCEMVWGEQWPSGGASEDDDAGQDAPPMP